ncbi:Dioxygenase [Actinokineospora iranica]|uniref:Dioxygenase n=2 Tax=Actinokineospora iranica TaxID=1271860 RepID=A0A1G6S5U3_9PSEU|nr:Dioxygenase [Actinokineospora iranica]
MASLGAGLTAAGLVGCASKPDPATASTAPGAATGATCDTVLAPEVVEGPYFIDGRQVRADITEGKPGVPVTLRLKVISVPDCAPLPNATVSIWHCDALGYYSGYTKNDPDVQATSGVHIEPTDDLTFLRGVQVSDAAGAVEFRTIYPGWYFGRAIHIHVKVFHGGHVTHTGQFYFDDPITDQVAALEPYRQHDFPRLRNSDDRYFTRQGGLRSVLATTQVDAGSLAAGLTASITVGVDPDATPAPATSRP